MILLRLIHGGLVLTCILSYLNTAALILVGLLTLATSLFTGEATQRLGGIATLTLALILGIATALALHAHRRRTA